MTNNKFVASPTSSEGKRRIILYTVWLRSAISCPAQVVKSTIDETIDSVLARSIRSKRARVKRCVTSMEE